MRGEGWTDFDTEKLRSMINRDLTWRVIASSLDRSEDSVIKRAERCSFLPKDNRGAKANHTRRLERDGWPPIRGTEEERDAAFVRAVVREAHALGLVRAA